MDNYIELLIRDRDQAKPDMDALKERLAELSKTVATARARVDDAGQAAKLDQFQAKLDDLGKKVEKPKISMSGAIRAEAQIHAIEASMDNLDKKADESKGHLGPLTSAVNDLTLGLTGGWGEMSTFQKVMAGFNIATGIGEPLVAGLTVAVGGLAGGLVAAGGAAGAFGLIAKANFTKASTAANAAQQAQVTYNSAVTAANAAYKKQMDTATTAAQRQSAATQKASALQSAYKARVQATSQAYANLTPAQVALSKQVGAMSNQWQSFTASFAPLISKLVGQVRPLFAEILPDIRKLATAGFTGISALLSQLGSNTGGFSKFIDMLAKNAPEAIVRLGVAIGHIITGIGGILKAFMPVSQGMLTGLDSITAKFAQWGQTLSGHSGFKDLMAMFRNDTPLAITALKNLASIAKIVASQMTGMDTFGNSKMFLQVAIAVSRLVNSLLRAHPELVWLIVYAKLGAGALGKLKNAASGIGGAWGGLVKGKQALSGLRAGFSDAEQAAAESTGAWGTFGGKVSSVLKGTRQAWNNFTSGFGDAAAAESSFSGKWGTFGGKVSSVFSSIGSAASSAWSSMASAASSAWSGITTGIGTAVTAVREWSIWSKIAALATRVWTGIQAAFDAVMDANPIAIVVIAIAALVAGVVLAYTHFKGFRDVVKAVFSEVTRIIGDAVKWVKAHWPLLLAILTGPIGLAILFVKEHYREITDVIHEAIAWVQSHWPLILSILTGPVGAAVIFIVRHWSQITAGAARMFHDVVSFFQRLPGDILHAVSSFGHLLFSAGEDLLRGLVSGIKSMVGDVIGEVEGVGKSILGGIESALGLGSPSKITFQHARWLWQGFINGGESMRGALAAHTRRMASVALPSAYGTGGLGLAGGGAGRQQLELIVRVEGTSDPLMRDIVKNLRFEVRTVGGKGPDSAQKFFGRTA